MKRDEGFAAALLAMAVGGAIALAIANDITAPLCAAAKIETAAPDKIEFGCLEFWLNRYQSLIGNILTAAVAGITLLWISRQLVAADQQAAIASSVALRTVVDEFEEHRKALVEIRKEADEYLWPYNDPPIQNVDIASEYADRLLSALSRFRVASAGFTAVAKKNRAPLVMQAADDAAASVKRMAEAINRINVLLDTDDETDIDLRLERAIEMISSARREMQIFHSAIDRARARIKDEVDAAWVKIRQLEYAAIGPWWRRHN